MIKQSISVTYQHKLYPHNHVFMAKNQTPEGQIDSPGEFGAKFYQSEEWKRFKDFHIEKAESQEKTAIFLLDTKFVM